MRSARAPSSAAPSSPAHDGAHAHLVCRRCGRISPLALPPSELLRLAAMAELHPPRWSVDGIAYSLTGVCPRCRELA